MLNRCVRMFYNPNITFKVEEPSFLAIAFVERTRLFNVTYIMDPICVKLFDQGNVAIILG